MEAPDDREDEGEAGCSPVTKVAFASTPRSGSSSVANILSRAAVKLDLVTALPHPGDDQAAAAREVERVHPMSEALGVDVLTASLVHWRNATALEAAVPGARLITLLRDPVDMFASMYMHTGLEFAMKADLDEFADDYAGVSVKRSARAKVGQNNLLWSLGVAHDQTTDQTVSGAKIREVQEKFGLVMVRDKFDESLVLLADMFCWPLEDMVYIKQNQRIEKVVEEVSNYTRKILSKWLEEDYRVRHGFFSERFPIFISLQLYNHFLFELERKIIAYGRERMARDVERLRELSAELVRQCVVKYRIVPEAKLSVGVEV